MGRVRQQKIDFFGQFRPTGIDSTAGAKFRQLAGLSESVSDLSFEIGAKKAKKKGLTEGAQAGLEAQKSGSELPLKEGGFLGSIETDVYNEAVKNAYLASLDNDNRVEIARIAAENPDDLSAFDNLVSSYSNTVLANIDPEVQTAAELTMNTLISTARQRIQAQEISNNVTTADNLLILSAETSARDAMRFANEGELDAAGMSLTSAFSAITARVDSGQLDPSAGKKLKRELKIATDVEVNRFTFKNMIENEGIAKAVGFLQRASDKPLKNFGVDEQRELIETLKSDLNNFIQLGNVAESQQQDTLVASQKAEASNLFTGIATGQTDATDVDRAMQQKQISFEQGSKLLNTLNTRGQGINDHGLINEINIMISADPDLAEQMIVENTGSRLTESMSTQMLKVIQDSEGAESPLKTSEARRFKSFLANSVKVVGALGAVDFDSQKRLAELVVAYDQRVLAGEDPAIVARDLVDVNDFLTAPNPRTGTKDDLQGAMDRLNEQLDANTIDEDTYNQQFDLITRLTDQKANLDQFNKALQEALKNGS